jgi:hypothetical protein
VKSQIWDTPEPRGIVGLIEELRTQQFGRVIVLEGECARRLQLVQMLGEQAGDRVNLGAAAFATWGKQRRIRRTRWGDQIIKRPFLFFDEADALFSSGTEVKDATTGTPICSIGSYPSRELSSSAWIRRIAFDPKCSDNVESPGRATCGP